MKLTTTITIKLKFCILALVGIFATGNSSSASTLQTLSYIPIGDTTWPMPLDRCTFELRFKKIPSGFGAHHAYVVCERVQSGKKELWGHRGGPSGIGGQMVPTGLDGNLNTKPDCFQQTYWGVIDTYSGPYKKGFPDWHEKHSTDPDQPFTYHGSEGHNCTLCNCIGDVLKSIESCCIEYKLKGPNSNSIILSALNHCMSVTPTPPLSTIPSELGIIVPGWHINQIISNCIQYSH